MSMSNALRFRAAQPIGFCVKCGTREPRDGDVMCPRCAAHAPDGVIAWYRTRTAERRWRNLMRYGSNTRRGQALAELMLHTLRRLGEWLSGRHHG